MFIENTHSALAKMIVEGSLFLKKKSIPTLLKNGKSLTTILL